MLNIKYIYICVIYVLMNTKLFVKYSYPNLKIVCYFIIIFVILN